MLGAANRDLAQSGGGATLGTGTAVVLLNCSRHYPEIYAIRIHELMLVHSMHPEKVNSQ